jgi:subtilase family serine protease/flagellar hook assembly protein FlgD
MNPLYRVGRIAAFCSLVIAAVPASVAFAAPLRTVPDEHALAQCVEIPVVDAKRAPATKAVGESTDIGNLTVMELDGDYGRGIAPPRQAVAQRFYQDHPDNYDFLIVYTTFEFETGDAAAFYNALRNPTAGIGWEQFDLGAAFGSPARLQGYLDMAAVSRWAFDTNDPRFEFARNVLAHELMHRWVAKVSYRTAQGADSPDLLGKDDVHWNYFLDTDASVMYGSDWQQRPDGRYEAISTRYRYSPLDLYLAGFAAPGEVPPMNLIRGGEGDRRDLPRLGAITAGTAEEIRVEQIIAAEGPRIPDVTAAQKDFRAALILLKRPGEAVPVRTLAALENVRVRFQQHFSQITDGRASLRIFNERLAADAAQPRLPDILSGSGAAPSPPGVGGAVAWLKPRQQQAGYWQDRPATALRDTQAVVRLLESVEPGYAPLVQARAWLAAQAAGATVEQQQWKLAAGDDAQLPTLIQMQSAAGGWGLAAGFEDAPLDTAAVAAALAARDAGSGSVQQALLRLGGLQNSDGSFGAAARGRGQLLPTLRAAQALSFSAAAPQLAQRDAALQWLQARQQFDGGFGTTASQVADSIELHAMLGRLPLTEASAEATRGYVRGVQQFHGDWEGSVYLTALAAYSQVLDQKVNLASGGTPSTLPDPALDGDDVLLSARIVNNGTIGAIASVARWYLGDPDQGGVQIGADIAVPPLFAGSSALLQQRWDSSGHAGSNPLVLQLDVTGVLDEQNEADNRIPFTLQVGAAPQAADIVLDARQLSLSPAAFDQLPATISLQGTVRNIGSTPVSAARLRLYSETTPPQLLAETTLDLPARGSAPLQLSFDVAAPAALRLLLRADPDNAVAEAREDNNDLRLLLPFGSSLDLELLAQDIGLVDATQAELGRDATFRVRVRNRGTQDSPPTQLRVTLTQGAAQETLFDAPVQIPAGQVIERRIPWRPRSAGAAQLQASVDPANQVAELDEGNNSAVFDFSVSGGQGADLLALPDSLQFTPLPAQQGQPLQLSLQLRNQGVEDAGPFKLALYASDPRQGGTRLAETLLPGLASGAQTTALLQVAMLNLSSETPVFVAIDADQAIMESDEGNNLTLRSLLVVPFADVAVSAAGVELTPNQPVPGAAQQARVRVRNLGGQEATNFRVRLLEGGAQNGTAVGADIVVDTLPAGGETTLTWNWTFGVETGARQLTVIADSGQVLRENDTFNNTAVLPIALQDGALYASELYISPNGDGVRDSTTIHFAQPGSAGVTIQIHNAADYLVRELGAAAGTPSAQVTWDGRDQRGRVVTDGSYRVSALQGGRLLAQIGVVVDTNRSSLIPAIGTPLLVDLRLNGSTSWFQPPLTDATRYQLFAQTRPANAPGLPEGLYRTHTLLPGTTPVVSSNWVASYLGGAEGGLRGFFDATTFSPDGRWVVLQILKGSDVQLAVASTTQSDTVSILDTALMSGALLYQSIWPRFIDDRHVIAGNPQHQLWVYDVQTGARTPYRSLPADTWNTKVFPHGIYVWSGASFNNQPSHYYPADAQRPPHAFVFGEELNYNSKLEISPDGRQAFVYRFGATQEALHLFQAGSGEEQLLLQRVPQALSFPGVPAPDYRPTLQAQWLSLDNSILLIDSQERRVRILAPAGTTRLTVQLPAADESLAVGPEPGYFLSDYRQVNAQYTQAWSSQDAHRQPFDPVRRRATVLLASAYAGMAMCGDAGPCVGYRDATIEAFAIDTDEGSFERVAAAQGFEQLPATLLPKFTLRDGAAFETDGRYRAGGGSLSALPWPDAPHMPDYISMTPFSMDDSGVLLWPALTNARHVASAGNLSAYLRAEPLERAIRLSGVAADHNFSHYQLDWASPATPTQWQAITPAQGDAVIGEDFLYWIPPQPGQYLLRLSVFDLAGNISTSYASALSISDSPLGQVGIDYRYFSPNGDGVQDAVTARFQVLLNAQITLRIRNAAGAVVREQSLVMAPGMHEYVWDGRDGSGALQPDGSYTLDLHGIVLKIVLDNTAPRVSGYFQQPHFPFVDAEGSTQVGSILLARAQADDATPGAKLYLQLSATGANEWRDWPRLEYASNGIITSADHLAGHELRAIGTDRAGNRTTLSLGHTEVQLRFVAFFANRGLGDIVDYGQEQEGWRPPTYPMPAAYPAKVTDYVADPNLPYSVLIQDLSPGFSAIDIEVADADAPGNWTVLTTLPGTLPPFVHEPGRIVPAALPFQGLPIGADRRLRPVGIRPDGSRVAGNHFRVVINGFDAPVQVCPEVNPDSLLELPEALRSLLRSDAERPIQLAVRTYVPNLSPHVRVELTRQDPETGTTSLGSATPVSHNDAGAVFYVPDSANGQSPFKYGASQILLASGHRLKSKTIDLGCRPGDATDGKRLELLSFPAIDQRCGSAPTGKVLTSTIIENVEPAQSAKLVLRAGARENLLYDETGLQNEMHNGMMRWQKILLADITGLPQGTASAVLDAVIGNVAVGFNEPLPVDHDAPLAELYSPSAGSRVCAVPDKDGFPSLDVYGNAASNTGTVAQMRLDKPEVPPAQCWDPITKQAVPGPCLALAGLPRPDPAQSLSTEVIGEFSARNGFDLETLNGTVKAELRVADWSGATVCTNHEFFLDSKVEIGEARPPAAMTWNLRTLLLQDGAAAAAPVLGLSRQGYPRYRQTVIRLAAGEPVDYRLTLYRASKLPDPGPPTYRIGDAVQELAAADAVNGSITLEWDGVVNGSFVTDGEYVLIVHASDGCGWTRDFHYVVEVDSTEPQLQITEPAPGLVPTAAVIEVRGTVDDAHFSSFPEAAPYWQLKVTGSEGYDQVIGDGMDLVPQTALLGRWNRGSMQTAGKYVLRALDDYGNTAQVDVIFVAPTPLTLLAGARLQPDLFSPNGDGRLDTTAIEVQLLAAANVDVLVRNLQGGLVATLAQDASLPAGSTRFDWNGAGAAGIAPDGAYVVDIVARSAADPGNSENATLSLTVDTTAPALTALTPAGAYARGQDSTGFTLTELHPDRYDARLLAADGSVAAQTGGANTGLQQLLATLDTLAEGDYRLEIQAQDRAGNRAEASHAFVLDKTPPVLALTAPVDVALLKRNLSTVLSGTAKDAHFAVYAVSIASTDVDNWTEITGGNNAVDNGPLGNWAVAESDGDYRLRLRGEDLAGNSAQLIQRVSIDGTPPTVAITVPAAGAALRGSLRAEGTASDAHLRDYALSIATPTGVLGNQWTPLFRGTSNVDAGLLAQLDLPLPDGDYTLRLLATDQLGQSSSTQVNIRLDRQAPPAPLQLRGRLESADAILDWNPADAGDVAGYALYRNGERINPALLTQPHHVDAGLRDGSWRYHVTALDQAGNESAPSNSVLLALDRTPPQVALQLPLPGARVHGLTAVSGTAWSEDDFAGFTLTARRSDGSDAPRTLAQGSLPLRDARLGDLDTLAWADETAVTLRLEARDNTGNSAQVETQVVIDNGPPAAPQGLTAVQAGLDGQVAWDPNSETDLLGYLLYRNGRLVNGPAELPADLRGYALAQVTYLDASLPDGTHTYVVFAIDQAGNISLPSAPASLDPINAGPPDLVIDTPQDNEAFEHAIDIRASSRDRDIVSVQFAWRAAGGGAWTNLGAEFSSEPYRLTWTPGALPYGDYEIRGLARDSSGLEDPQPPVVRVRYADLTPPAAPSALRAVADGDTVQLSWTAATGADVAGYRVERYDNGWQPVGDESTALTRSDPGLAERGWEYRVRALDASGNLSTESTDTAQVFSLELVQPFTPVTAASVPLQGRSPLPGDLSLGLNGGSPAASGASDAAGDFLIPAVTLQSGENEIAVRLTTAAGDRSLPATVWVTRAAAPTPPTGLALDASGHDVQASWNANPEADVLGYRVQHNGGLLPPDALLASGVSSQSATCCDAANASDNDAGTAWNIATWIDAAQQQSSYDPTLELSLDQPHIVTALQLEWQTAQQATGNLDVEARTTRGAWVRVAQLRGSPAAVSTVTLDQPYRSDALRLVLRSPEDSAVYAELALAEVRVRERSLVSATDFSHSVVDGLHRYRIAAVNAAALQSDWSAVAEIGIGDTVPPDAVLLSGTLQDNTATLEWSASSAADIARYELSRDGLVIANLPAAQPRRHMDANLALGSYSYQVIAYDAFNNASTPSNTVTLTVEGSGPGIPVGLRVEAPPEGRMLDVSWNAGAGTPPVAYVLRRGAAAAGPFVEIATIPATARRDINLTNGVTYHYTVEAIDAAGNRSGQSAPASGTPRDLIAPAQPLLTHATVSSLLLHTDRDRSLVCGMAEAGAQVRILRDGQETAQALSVPLNKLQYSNRAAYGLLVAADGLHGAAQNNGVQLFALDGDSTTALGADTRQPVWSAHGATLYYADSTQIYARRPGRPAQALPWQADSLQGFALSADEQRVLLLGSYAPGGGSATEGVWWMQRDGSAARRIAGMELADLLNPVAQIASNARYAVLPLLDGRLRVLDLANAAVRDSFEADVSIRPGWSPDGRRLAFVRYENSASTIWIYDAQTRQLSALLTPQYLIAAIAWSPDGTQLAVLDSDGRIEWRSPADASLLGQMDTGSYSPAPETFVWTASGRIFFVAMRAETGAQTLVSVQPAGWFCSEELSLRPGLNTFAASAVDAAGNASVPAQPIRIELSGAQLPDLALSANDVFFLPAAPAPGQAVTALVTLRNLGQASVAEPALRALLLQPGGGSRDVSPSTALAALNAGEARSLSLSLGTLTQPGIYRLRLLADPQGLVNESDEDNNSAEGQLALSLNAEPLIDVSTSSSLYAPGETMVGEIRVSNPGAPFSGRVRASIVDASNALVADLGESTLTDLGYAQRWTRAVDWRAAGVFAGDYRLRARLLRSDGSALAEQSAAFAIGAQRHITLDIAADPRVQRSGMPLTLASSLHFVDGNALLTGASLRASVHDANGNEVWASTQVLGVLEPGYQMRKEDLWNTAGSAAGVYTLRLRLQSADHEASAESSVTLTDDNGLRLGGAISLLPAQQLVAGQAGSLVYRVDNGGAALSGVELRLEVYQSLDQPALIDRFETIDLPSGASREARLDITAPPLALQNHIAVLSANAGGEGWRVIARQGFPVIDALPPTIQPRLPREGQLQPAVVTLRADISDAHSSVALAEMRIDGGGWQPVSRAAGGGYERVLSGLADGPHQLSWRARDSWGNEAVSATLPFETDATPPLIAISGVSEGQLSNQVLSPTVTLSDAHLDLPHSLVQLDGQPYVSGTPISADGEHTIAVRAVDTAGNQSLAAVHFRIDRTPPPLAILQPADGSVVSTSSIDVQVQSEALATIALQVGSYQAQATADAAGLAAFTAVPLQEGDNRIEAGASDAAGNSSGPLGVDVRYETSSSLPLVGTLQPALAEVPHGQPLAVTLRLRNPGSAALPVQTLRLGVHAAGGAQLAQRDYARPFAAGEEFSDTPQFDTSAWALGGLELKLEILREGSWQLLDTQQVQLVDRTPPQLQAVAPLAGVVLRAPLQLRATAADALSPPVTVEASVDDGPWAALSADAGTPGSYSSNPLKLPDGVHHYALRARDAAGNETALAPLTFTVDNSAPLIAVSGVADGDLLNHAVTPLISITDANLAQSGSTLNGQPYASGTPVTASGDYLLQVSASDAAGNSAAQELRFTLDLDAPTVTVTEPLAGSTVSVAAQEIAGNTEPLADVTVEAPGLSTIVRADASGAFRTAAALLKPGLNTLRLRATDRAGNTGPETMLTVTYEPPAGQQLSAQFLGAPYAVLRGQPIDTRYVLRNSGTLGFTQVPVRVRLSDSGGTQVALDSFSLTLAGQAEVTRSSAFISNDLPLGRYHISISAELRDGQGQPAWVQLAEATADLRSGCRLPHDRIFADGFDLPDLIWCDSFDPPLPPKLAPAAPRTGRNTARLAPLPSPLPSSPLTPSHAAADNHAVTRGVQE